MKNSLIEEIIKACDLPEFLVKKELYEIIRSQNKNPESIDLESLREVLAKYVQDALLEAKKNF